MANYNVTNYNEIVSAINTANNTTANDSLFLQNDITLTPSQTIDLFNIPSTAGTLRFRSQQVVTTPATTTYYTLVVDSDLNIKDITPATAQPSFTIGPLVLQIGNRGTTGGIAGNLRADDGGVLVFNRSVDTTYTGTFSVEEEDNGLLNAYAGTTVTLDGSQGTNGLAIRASQGTGAASFYDLDIGGAGDGVISGIIADGGLADTLNTSTNTNVRRSGDLTKVGDGTWTLSGANTYVGLTHVEDGVLVVSNALGLGAGIGGGSEATAAKAGTIVSAGATLALTGGITVASEALTLSGAGVVEGTETSGALQNLSGANTFGGPITLAADALISSKSGALMLTGGVGGAHVLTLGGDGDGVIDQAGSGAGIAASVTGLVKEGDGTWALKDVSAFAGPTTVNDGVLQVDGSIANSTVTVNDGGVLAGTGTVGDVTLVDGATLATGDNGVGALTTGDLEFSGGATFKVEIGGTGVGQYDQAIVNGEVDLGDAGIEITLVNGYTAVLGDTFTLVSNDGTDEVQDEFDDLEEGGVFVSNGHSYKISYVGGDGNDITVKLVNQDPTATDDELALDQRTTQSGDVLTDGSPDTDPENGALSVAKVEFGGEDYAVTPSAPVSILANYGTLTISADGDYTYFANVEGEIAVGDTATDTFESTVTDPDGGEAEAELTVTVTGSAIGTSGDNTFLLTGSGTTASGLGGDDTYTVDSQQDRPVEAANGGDDTVLASVSYALYAGQEIEHLATTDADGTTAINLAGNAFDNEITGNAGANILNGRDGNDTLIGLDGADRYIVSTGDTVVELADNGVDTVYATSSFTLSDNVENIRAYGAAAIDGASLTGNDLDNLIAGGAGDDVLTGGAGADRYYVTSGDSIVELGDGGVDTVYASGSYTLDDNVENIRAYGASGDAGVSLTGNGLANSIIGGAGDDTLSGLDGNDRYYVTAGDHVVESADGGVDTVYAGSDYTLDDNVEIIRAYGAGGNAGVSFTGNGLANSFIGGSGDDTFTGLGGNDRYYVTAGDHVVESAGGGLDTVYTAGDYALDDNVENIRAYGAGAAANGGVELTGNDEANVIVGGAGNDTLIGGGGLDRLYGNGGDDVFVFNVVSDSALVYDRIYGFTQGHDLIDLSNIQAVTGAPTDQPFDFIGDDPFTGVAGQLHQRALGGSTLIEADVNGDGTYDFRVALVGEFTLTSNDFIL